MDKTVKNNVCLAIIFNHKYEKNLKILDSIYKDRFKNIFYIMPFYTGDRKDVVPVYENSYQFQGYICQFVQFLKNEINKYTQFVFVADDILLNPKVNEKNILKVLSIKNGNSYIKSLIPVSDTDLRWAHSFDSELCFLGNTGTEFSTEIPSKDSVIQIFKKNNIKYIDKTSLSNLRGFKDALITRGLLKFVKYLVLNKSINRFPYPLVKSYSDFFVVSAKSIKRFAHYCGVFAAMRIFVETAIPTALLLSNEDKKILLEKDIKLKGIEIWKTVESERLENKMNFKITKLQEYIEKSNLLYIHPIKLSKWMM